MTFKLKLERWYMTETPRNKSENIILYGCVRQETLSFTPKTVTSGN